VVDDLHFFFFEKLVKIINDINVKTMYNYNQVYFLISKIEYRELNSVRREFICRGLSLNSIYSTYPYLRGAISIHYPT
jgi:hypothetical protein